MAASINDLQKGEISLYEAGKLTRDEHHDAQEGFKTLAQEDIAVRKCIANTNAPSCVDSGIAAVQAFLDSNVNGFKNPDARDNLKLLGQGLITSLNILKGAI